MRKIKILTPSIGALLLIVLFGAPAKVQAQIESDAGGPRTDAGPPPCRVKIPRDVPVLREFDKNQIDRLKQFTGNKALVDALVAAMEDYIAARTAWVQKPNAESQKALEAAVQKLSTKSIEILNILLPQLISGGIQPRLASALKDMGTVTTALVPFLTCE